MTTNPKDGGITVLPAKVIELDEEGYERAASALALLFRDYLEAPRRARADSASTTDEAQTGDTA